MQIKLPENCQNSPKNYRVQECTSFLYSQNMVTISQILSENVCWVNIGKGSVEGKNPVLKALLERNSIKITRLEILQIMSHGKEGSANGIITLEDGNKWAFAEFFSFSSVNYLQIKTIRSFLISLNSG